jgi:uncharacterized membrane protein
MTVEDIMIIAIIAGGVFGTIAALALALTTHSFPLSLAAYFGTAFLFVSFALLRSILSSPPIEPGVDFEPGTKGYVLAYENH